MIISNKEYVKIFYNKVYFIDIYSYSLYYKNKK